MNPSEKQLLSLFSGLGAANQATLLAFARFLSSSSGAPIVIPDMPPVVIPEPEKIGRPENESVVAGLKRLSKTYPMLDKQKLLRATSDMVATSIMQGTDPAQVIDELEMVFSKLYRELKSGTGA